MSPNRIARQQSGWDVGSSADLFGLVLLVALTNAVVFLPGGSESLVRPVVGIAFVLFAPGYALVSMLFPEAVRPFTEQTGEDRQSILGRFRASGRENGVRGIDGLERVALAFALSLGVVPLLVIGLSVTPVEFALLPVVSSLSVVTLLCTGIAVLRRQRLPEGQRFQIYPRQWVATGAELVTNADSRFNAALHVGLAVAILFAVGALSFAIVSPQDGEQFTNFYITTENADGELVEAGYPTTFDAGEEQPVVLSLTNQEHEAVEYTIVTELHRIESGQVETETRSAVTEEEELRRFQTRLGHSESWNRTYSVAPTMAGDNLRLTFLLYKGQPPANPTVENAYRELHLWISVDR